MKKIIILSILFSFFALNVSLSQNNSLETNSTNIEFTSAEEIANIEKQYGVFFCNDENAPTKDLAINTSQGEKNEICLYFINDSKTDINVIIGITDGFEKVNSVGEPYIGCQVPGDGSSNEITNYLTQDRESPITIPAESRIMKKVYATFPIGKEGIVNSCLLYSLEQNERPAGNMFNMRFRVKNFIKFFVSGDFSGKNNIEIKDTLVTTDENKNTEIKTTIASNSPINNNVDVKIEISNMFGYNKIMTFSGKQLKTQATLNISSKDLSENIILPSYKGLYKIKIDVVYKPYFEFDISNLNLDPELLEEKKITKTISYFQMPRTYLGGAILIIFLLFIAFRKKKPQVVYVQQPTVQ